ncbi:hypothetical protein CsSME_00046251 [Camellia sinensis var. sinensis]
MAVGVFLVIIILLFQGMKLLPTGRKNVFYLTLYGSVVSIFVLLEIVVAGAALGYWMVWKFVISDDVSVDVGVAQFVKWAMCIIAATFIFQVAIVFMLINSVIMLYLRISGPNGNQCAICFAFLNFLFLFSVRVLLILLWQWGHWLLVGQSAFLSLPSSRMVQSKLPVPFFPYSPLASCRWTGNYSTK